jgi:LPS sulfotransferase NodH
MLDRARHRTERRTVRFVILATARTGSNLLLSLLSNHPAIKTHGELFKLDALSSENLRHVLDDPITYLHERLYKPQRDTVTAVGFKLFYYHLTLEHVQVLAPVAAFVDAHYDRPTLEQRFKDAWDRLIENQELAIIHLKRRNMLETLVSLKTAMETQQWWSVVPKEDARLTLHLDPEECRQYFCQQDQLVAAADAAFAHHRKMEVVYEDLVEQPQETLSRVFEFLNVPWHSVTTRMRKQRSAPVREIVRNYGELKESCRNTRWASYFE